MKVNDKLYDVYPDIRSLTGSGKHYLESTKYKKELEKLQNINVSIAIYRQVALKIYYQKFVDAVKKKASTKGKVTRAELDLAIK